MKFSIFKLAFIAFFCLNSLPAKEDPKTKSNIQRTISLTPGIFDERMFNSNDMMKEIPLSYMQAMSSLFDYSINISQNKLLNYGCAGFVALLDISIATANNVAYHEFGHARALNSFGVSDYSYGVPDFQKKGYAYQTKTMHDLFWVILARFEDYEKTGAYCGWSSGVNFTSKQDIIISAAGLNNQMRYSQSIADVIHEQKGHFLYIFDYYMGKNSSYRYADITEQSYKIGYVSTGNDIHAVITELKNNGINISTTDIKDASYTSLLLSSTTWAFVYAGIFNLPKGNFEVPAAIWKGWRLPDTNFYMTTKGLSYEVVTGFHIDEHWYIGLSIEYIFKGKSFFELSPELSYQFAQPTGLYKITGKIVLSEEGDFGGSTGLDWVSNKKFFGAGVKYTCHNTSTLVGERNIPFAKKGAIGHELSIIARFMFK
jgi:hypothetical protein